ncbi:MAG: hypothetical protein Q7W05_14115 [Deltaproteobacteria bacterium]|nr:hypothetical protein [Deltaproteobacteria bacterium]
MQPPRFGKFITYVGLNIFLGLIQLWVVAIILWIDPSVALSWTVLLRDGGLYFFSSSLVLSSVYSLFSYNNVMKVGSVELNTTIFLACPVLLLASIGYAVFFTRTQINALPISEFAHSLAQLVCASSALAYAVFCADSTGQLKGHV